MTTNRWSLLPQLVEMTDRLLRKVGSLDADDQVPKERFSCIGEAMAVKVPFRTQRSAYPHWPAPRQ